MQQSRLVTAAWADGKLTEREWSDIQAIGSVLEVDDATILNAATPPVLTTPTLSTGFRLVPGDTIVITGDTRRDRPESFRILEQMGFVPKNSMVKSAKVLVAADPDSMSGKAKQARQYGIPIITEDGLERLLGMD